jgi:hypothetical protein
VKHHFVPQFLLRRWTDASGKVRVFEVKAGKLVSDARAPEYTGYEEDLYAVDGRGLGIETHHFEETLFGPIDNNAANALKKIENKEELSEGEHQAWTTFLASLRVRSPDTIDYLRNEAVERLRAKLAERDQATLPADWPSTEIWADKHFPGLIENVGLTFLQRMIDHPQIMQTFETLNSWCYKFSDSDPPLLLPDLPLHWEGKLADPDFWIMMPIAPDRAFFGTRNERTADRLTELGAVELANQLNRASVASAVRRIWSREAEPARTIISAHLPIMGANTTAFRSLILKRDKEDGGDAAIEPVQ